MKRILKFSISVMVGTICLLLLATPRGYLNTSEIVPPATGPAMPVELLIERIGIQAPIEPVGVLSNGAMAVPSFANNVGWYNRGTNPGDTGSAVLAGHVNWLHGGDAVFTKLYLIEIGDVAGVMDTYGAIDYFIVRDIKRFAADADTAPVFVGNRDAARLNLITCDGTWNEEKGTHESRLVVFMEKI